MKINTLGKGEQLKKYHVALLLNNGTSDTPDWVQIEKSTDNTITMNAETEDRDFIVDTNPTTILLKYKPSMSEPITLYKGNPDYEFFWKKFYNRSVGSNASTEILVVFMNEEPESGKYQAWRCDCVCVCDNLNPVDSTLTFTINFNGSIKDGTVSVTDGTPVFTATESSDSTSSDSTDSTDSTSDTSSGSTDSTSSDSSDTSSDSSDTSSDTSSDSSSTASDTSDTSTDSTESTDSTDSTDSTSDTE